MLSVSPVCWGVAYPLLHGLLLLQRPLLLHDYYSKIMLKQIPHTLWLGWLQRAYFRRNRLLRTLRLLHSPTQQYTRLTRNVNRGLGTTGRGAAKSSQVQLKHDTPIYVTRRAKYYLITVLIEVIAILSALLSHKAPEAMTTLHDAVESPLLNCVEQEGAEKVRINVLDNFHWIGMIELESCRKLDHQLVHAIEEL